MATTDNSAKARRDEANPEEAKPTVFEHGNETYTIEPHTLDNVDLFEAIEDQNYITAARGFVGRDQWSKFKEANRTDDGRVPMKSVEEFLSAMMEAVGAGN